MHAALVRSMTPRRLLPLALLASLAAACGGTAGEDVDSSGAAASGDTCRPALADGAVSKVERALLDTIATTEGTYHAGANDGYDVTFDFHHLSSCVHDTDVAICSGGLCSTAQGRYQFLFTTFEDLHLPNFEPNHQDIGAMMLVRQRGVSVPDSRVLSYDEFVGVMNEVSYVWASLPPGRYGQPSRSMSEAWDIYSGFAHGAGGGASSGGGGKTNDGTCSMGGHTYTQNTCTDTRQCDDGRWVARSSDPSSCKRGIESEGRCVTDSGSIVAQNTCTSTLQCDDGVWVARDDDPTSCR
jgi:muramidase (phage lysozyme)